MLADMCEHEPSGFIQRWGVLDSNSKAEFCTIELVEGMACIIHITEYFLSYR
jgi:hypothetical protein